MATKQSNTNELQANQIIIAEGTNHARKHTLKILRGKKYRANHLQLLTTFATLEEVSRATQDDKGGGLRAIINAIEELFGQEGFEEEMLPFSLGMETDEEREYLEDLLPLEQFMAYMAGAAYIVNGAQSEGVQASLKK